MTEEIIYRGFLIYALSQLFPDFSIWFVLIISSILFSLAHTYQGFPNVIRTTIFGFFIAVLYIGLGSIIPLILFHFLVDYIAKIGEISEEKAESFQSINKNL
ncbi:CPBP family intramembrane glutamic endopeptidase [Niallia oryzisoli]|uniref:CPBP family intramembrane glutamic endopeptidase n=1 Tax=Niallia oryzisoli TaxID=1737571 RepID=UPI003BB012D6